MLADGVIQGLSLLVSGDPDVWEPIALSLSTASLSTVLATVVAIPLGVLLGLGRFRGRAALTALVHTAMATPTVLIGLLVFGFISRQGPLGQWGLLYTPTAIVIGQVLLALPLLLGLCAAALEGADPRIAPTALGLGASRWRAAWWVVRDCRPALLAALAAGFGRVFAEIGVALMLGGNIRGYTRTITTGIAYETGRGEFARGVALGVVLLAVALAVNAALLWWRHGQRAVRP